MTCSAVAEKNSGAGTAAPIPSMTMRPVSAAVAGLGLWAWAEVKKALLRRPARAERRGRIRDALTLGAVREMGFARRPRACSRSEERPQADGLPPDAGDSGALP